MPPVEGAPVLPREVHNRGGDQERHAGKHGTDPEHEGDREHPRDQGPDEHEQAGAEEDPYGGKVVRQT